MSTRTSPVYQQLNEQLRLALRKTYSSGDKFLTERQISEQFSVSRATANKALANLVSEGVLEFRRGIGTFVRAESIDYDVRSLVSFSEKARAAGRVPTTRVLAFQPQLARRLHPDLRTALQLFGEEEVWEVRRLRFADDVPVILEHRYLVRRHCPDLTADSMSGSLYQALTQDCALEIAGADDLIRAVSLTSQESEQLRVAPHAPTLEVTAIGYLRNRQPLWWERTLYRGDRYEFHSRLGPIRSATPARGQLR